MRHSNPSSLSPPPPARRPAPQHPFFLSLDDISFRLPVAIGSVLRLTTSVAYVPEGDSSAIQTDVEAEVVDPT